MTAPAVAAALIAPMAVAGAAAVLGLHRRRSAPAAADLLAASRGVTPWWNASAIGAEHLSAAAYLGTAGLVLAYGADVLWLPVAGTAGYVLLLAFVTAPLRRPGRLRRHGRGVAADPPPRRPPRRPGADENAPPRGARRASRAVRNEWRRVTGTGARGA